MKRRDRPYLALILAADLGAETLGCYRGTSYRTPNLDSLARTSDRFQHARAHPLARRLPRTTSPYKSNLCIEILETFVTLLPFK
jgi:hypothetical protein